jgi:phage terminase large subunit GpA-like protein
MSALRPPPKMRLSEWADAHFVLSAESSAEPGRWRTLAYQRGPMDAITDPNVERVSFMKSARIGYTKMIDATVGYFIHQDPCPIMVVQPTVDDAEGYSKEEIAPMVRDCAVLTDLVGAEAPRRGRPKKGKERESSTKTSSETILLKKFPGGLVEVVGANSGRGFRRRSRRVVIFDEVDGYPASAGNEGDPVKLGERRAEYYWNRKIIAGSTPLIAGASRIEELFEAGDRRRYYVPCPHCGHMDYLKWSGESGDASGHVMRFPDGPASAHFECSSCHGKIEESSKREIIERGEWRAQGEFTGHASFHIWAAYSSSPNASWSQLVQEFLDAKSDPLKLKTFVNTVLGETWQERGDAPDWERLFNRRETYKICTVPTARSLSPLAWTFRKTGSFTRSSAGARTRRAGLSTPARSSATPRSRRRGASSTTSCSRGRISEWTAPRTRSRCSPSTLATTRRWRMRGPAEIHGRWRSRGRRGPAQCSSGRRRRST